MKKFIDTLKKSKEGILISAVVSFLTFVYAPIELYVSSQSDFWFTLGVLLKSSILWFFVIFFIFAATSFLLRLIGPKPYNIGLIVGASALFTLYVQGNFFVSALPPLDGTGIEWNSQIAEMIKSWGAVLVIAGIFVFLFIKLKKKTFKKIVLYSSSALGAILLITLTTLLLTTEFEDKQEYLTPTGYNCFEYSEDENLIVLVIDAVDDGAFERQLQKYPEFKDTFDDFTRYDNALAGYPYTLHSMPFMFSGVWYENEESFSEYSEKAFEKSPLVKKINDDGYKAGFYNDGEIYFKKGGAGEVFENQAVIQPKFKNQGFGGMVLFKMSSIRYAPWNLKFFGYDIVDYVNYAKTIPTEGGYNDVPKRNPAFYEAICEDGTISVCDEKCVRIIHIEGGHVPYRYNKKVELVEDAKYEDNVDACLTICDRYLKALKESDVYDNSAIVILADHGYVWESHPTLPMSEHLGRMNPVLYVKGIGDKGEERAVASTPVSYEDLADAFVKLMDGASADGLFDEYVKEERRLLWYRYLYEDYMVEYVTKGNAKDVEAMQKTGKEYILE